MPRPTGTWAERFDRDLKNMFELQNDVTGRIAAALNLELLAAEADRPIGNPDALDYILRGRGQLIREAHRRSRATPNRSTLPNAPYPPIRARSTHRPGWRIFSLVVFSMGSARHRPKT